MKKSVEFLPFMNKDPIKRHFMVFWQDYIHLIITI